MRVELKVNPEEKDPHIHSLGQVLGSGEPLDTFIGLEGRQAVPCG